MEKLPLSSIAILREIVYVQWTSSCFRVSGACERLDGVKNTKCAEVHSHTCGGKNKRRVDHWEIFIVRYLHNEREYKCRVIRWKEIKLTPPLLDACRLMLLDACRLRVIMGRGISKLK